MIGIAAGEVAGEAVAFKMDQQDMENNVRSRKGNPTKEVADIRAIQLNSSFTQVTFFHFIADGFKNIFIHNKTSRISSVNNYINLFGFALAS